MSPWPALSILILALVLAVATTRRLRARPATTDAPDPGVTRWMRRINITTAAAALLYGFALSQAGQEPRAIAAVLVVLGVHFVPMWRLLRRRSLLGLGIALIVIGLLVWHSPVMAASGCFFAALLFAGTAVRLLLREPPEPGRR